MRIAFVIDSLYPWELGGAHKRVWEIGKRLADNHDVHVFGMKYWDGPNTIKKDGMTYHGVCEKQELYEDGKRSLTQPLVYSASLFRPLFARDFDVIDCQKSSYFHFFPSKAYSSVSDTALVGTFTEIWGDYWYEYLGKKGIFGKLIERIALTLPDHIITISEKNVVDLEEWGISTSNVTVIPDGIGFEEIDSVPAAEKSFDVLYAGRLVEHKNVDLLLDAITLLRKTEGQQITCGIIGDGPDMEALQQQAKTNGITDAVEFVGFLEDINDVYGYMKSSDVFVLPSSREGAGLVTLEANACGVPSITTRHENNAATEVVENGVNGYISEMDVDDLAQTIRMALTQSSELRETSIAYAKQYEWDSIAEDTLAVYKEAIN
ncbi:glycosyltransferase [Halomicrobium mukohataei]|uniref:Glycosyltransferase n=1 Tax=Halomicrobium mukohataei TaxID=57705 RepID=A0A847U706_9EURY|nr:glycosyltransferase family 4 protein [Halomicrobium mukohataei]NLV08386.1 glycosyltransferase [Halomicrobium mukohataei]